MPKYSENNRILVIDDEPSIHKDFGSILSPAAEDGRLVELEANLFGMRSTSAAVSFSIESAFQGQDGVERAKSALAKGKPFCVAFVDMRMPPGWDGLRTIKELWEADPRLQVVLCTAYSDHSWTEVLNEIGARDRLLVIKKPFDPIEVSTAASALAAKWNFARESEETIALLERTLADQRAMHGGGGGASCGAS